MPIVEVSNIGVKGIYSIVPNHRESNRDYPFKDGVEAEKFIQTTGIEYRYTATAGTALSDLALPCSQRLLKDLNWDPQSVEFLIVVTQTPDFRIPGNAPILQHRIGMANSCLAFDINIGCSGYVYGLFNIMSIMSMKAGSRGLLIVGDLSSTCINPGDRSTYPLFSDAVSVTALEWEEGALAKFNLQTNGKGYQAIQIPEGGTSKPLSKDSLTAHEIEPGIIRRGTDMILNGADVFHFSLKEVAPNLQELLNQTDVTPDLYFFHQANKLMNDMIVRKMGLESKQAPQSLKNYGNTSSASIPITICSTSAQHLASETVNLALSGFGVGLSWASAIISTKEIACIEPLIYSPE